MRRINPARSFAGDVVQGQVPGNVISACFGLAGFVVALIGGLAASRNAANILASATIALLACYVLGLIIARVASSAIREIDSPDQPDALPAQDTDQNTPEAA